MVIIDDSYPENNHSSASHFIDWLNTKAGQDIPRLITDLKSKDYSDDLEKTKAYMDMRSQIVFYYQLGLISDDDYVDYLNQVDISDTN